MPAHRILKENLIEYLHYLQHATGQQISPEGMTNWASLAEADEINETLRAWYYKRQISPERAIGLEYEFLLLQQKKSKEPPPQQNLENEQQPPVKQPTQTQKPTQDGHKWRYLYIVITVLLLAGLAVKIWYSSQDHTDYSTLTTDSTTVVPIEPEPAPAPVPAIPDTTAAATTTTNEPEGLSDDAVKDIVSSFYQATCTASSSDVLAYLAPDVSRWYDFQDNPSAEKIRDDIERYNSRYYSRNIDLTKNNISVQHMENGDRRVESTFDYAYTYTKVTGEKQTNRHRITGNILLDKTGKIRSIYNKYNVKESE